MTSSLSGRLQLIKQCRSRALNFKPVVNDVQKLKELLAEDSATSGPAKKQKRLSTAADVMFADDAGLYDEGDDSSALYDEASRYQVVLRGLSDDVPNPRGQ